MWLDFSLRRRLPLSGPGKHTAGTRRTPCRLQAQPAAVLSQAICGHAQCCLQLGQTENMAEHWNPGALPILVVSRGDDRMALGTQKGMGVLEASEMSSTVLDGLLPRSQRPT